MLLRLLGSYFISLLVLVAAIIGITKYFKRKSVKIKYGSVVCGVLISAVCLAIVFLLFTTTFNANFSSEIFVDSTKAAGETVALIILIGAVYIFVLSFIRSLLLNTLFFGKGKRETGLSFAYGFAISPAFLIGLLYLKEILLFSYYGIFHGPAEWIADEERFRFSDSSAFNPALNTEEMDNFYLMLFLVALALIIFCNSIVFDRIVRKRYKFYWGLIAICIVFLMEAALFAQVPFCGLFSWLSLSLEAVLLAACCLLAVKFIPRKKEESSYTKQFE